jgi:predicted metalloprotease with PDZ domain
MSGELWLAEGFTNYYGPLISLRAGVSGIPDFVGELSHVVNALLTNPGRALHSAEEMSRLAPFVDAATSIDRTAFANTFLSYYTFGQAIGLGLDLSLRARSNGAVTLDHFMRALWLAHGKPGGTVPGTVDRPYTMTDLEAALASASGDPAFARDFFARYIQGREAVDYATLLARAGLLLRRVSPGRAFAGDIQLRDVQGRPRVADAVPFGSPAYAAGLDRDDVILAVAGKETSSAVDVEQAIRAARPGDQVPIVFERRGARVGSTLRLVEDPHVEVVRFEDAGRALTADQRQFRDAWLGSAAGRRF